MYLYGADVSGSGAAQDCSSMGKGGSIMWVQCKKTGRWYDPQSELRKVLSSPEVIAMFKRLKDR